MRRLLTLGFAAVAVTLSVVGCNDSDDEVLSGGAGAAGTAGSAGSAGSAGAPVADKQCVGTYSDVTLKDYTDEFTADKGCSSDIDTTCLNDMTRIVGTCGRNCNLMGGTDEAQAQCIATCLEEGIPAPHAKLSDLCVECYVHDVACARTNCLARCGLAPTSADCAACRSEAGCADAFYECSGLPQPSGT